MIITMYELLGMVKDGKVPKKIRYLDKIFNYNKQRADYLFIETYGEATDTREYLTDWIGLSKDSLNDEVEILEEEKKIPEKLEIYKSDDGTITGLRESINIMFNDTASRINSIIDYLKSKGDE